MKARRSNNTPVTDARLLIILVLLILVVAALVMGAYWGSGPVAGLGDGHLGLTW